MIRQTLDIEYFKVEIARRKVFGVRSGQVRSRNRSIPRAALRRIAENNTRNDTATSIVLYCYCTLKINNAVTLAAICNILSITIRRSLSSLSTRATSRLSSFFLSVALSTMWYDRDDRWMQLRGGGGEGSIDCRRNSGIFARGRVSLCICTQSYKLQRREPSSPKLRIQEARSL